MPWTMVQSSGVDEMAVLDSSCINCPNDACPVSPPQFTVTGSKAENNGYGFEIEAKGARGYRRFAVRPAMTTMAST